MSARRLGPWTDAEIVTAVVLGLTYGAIAVAIFAWLDPDTSGAAFWPAAGITLGTLLRTRRAAWPLLLGAVAIADLAADLLVATPPAAAVLWAASNVVEPLVGAMLVSAWLAHPRSAFDSVRGVARFLVAGALIGPLVGATLGTAGSVAVLGQPLLPTWPKWAIGDAIGVMTIAPFILVRRPSGVRVSRAVLWASVGGVATISAGGLVNYASAPAGLALLVPVVILAAAVDGAWSMAISGATIGLTLELITATGRGPFGGQGVDAGLLSVQLVLVCLVVTGLVVAALRHDLDAKAADLAVREASRALDERFQRLVGALREGVVLRGADGRLLAANGAAAEIMGVTSEELFQRDLTVDPWEAVDEAGEPVAPERWPSMVALRSGVPVHDVVLGLPRAGREPTWVLMNAEPLIQPGEDRPYAVAVSFVDISERRRLEERLRDLARRESVATLAAGVAHEFNNQLTVVLGNVDLLDQEIDPARRRDDLAAIRSAANRTRSLTAELLAYARRTHLQPREAALGEMVDRALSLIRPTLGPGVRLDRLGGRADARIVADPERIAQVLVAVIENSAEALPDGGRITVESGVRTVPAAEAPGDARLPAGTWATIVVHDDGTGMSEDERSRATEPFFTTKGLGRGLGLAAAQGIVTQSGGSLAIESTPGRGTTVTIALPTASAAGRTPAAPSPRA